MIGIDVNPAKVDAINAGLSPVREPGLDELVAEARTEGLLSASLTPGEELFDADLAIVCVGTPSGPDGAHDMGHIVQVTRSIAEALQPGREGQLTVAYRSTMRPGSMETLIRPIFEASLGNNCEATVELVYNPEFLREASAIEDFFTPPKIVVGTRDGKPSAAMDALHEGIDAPTFHVGYREAELTKFVDNSWHATKVVFANEIGRLCAQLGISASQVHAMFAADTRLNISPAYTRPGGAFGGSCLPKDVRALQHLAAEAGASAQLIDSLMSSNAAHLQFQFDRVAAAVEPGAKILLVGLSFKLGTDDLRESPALDLARRLIDARYRLAIYEAELSPNALLGQNRDYAMSHLPELRELLVDRETAQAGDFALAVATNRLVDTLDLGATPVLDLSVIA